MLNLFALPIVSLRSLLVAFLVVSILRGLLSNGYAQTKIQLKTSLTVHRVAGRLGRITALIPHPTHPKDLLVIQGNGIVSVLTDGAVRRKDFLDIEDLLSSKNPEALYSMAFSRHFPVTRYAYIGYVDRQGDSVVGRVTVNPDDEAPAESLRVELKVVQNVQHQRTGGIAFGSDDALYVATGDGGSESTSESSAQNTQSLLGKVLRIEVGQEDYKIPATNPHAHGGTFLPEIFSVGLRAPSQLLNGKVMLVLDRGKSAFDELNLVTPKANFGWPLLEGQSPVQGNENATGEFAQPLVSYQKSAERCLGAATELQRNERRFLLFSDCRSGTLYAREWLEDTLSPDIIEIGSSNQPTSALLSDDQGDLLLGTPLGEVYKVTGILR